MAKRRVRPVFKLLLMLIVIAILATIYNRQVYPHEVESAHVVDGAVEPLKAPDSIEETIAILNKRAKQDKDYQQILDQVSRYDEDLLSALAVNSELKDFVLHYFDDFKEVAIDTTKERSKQTVPLFMQWDERWGYYSYGDGVIGTTGCGPTAMAMVVAALTKREDINPLQLAKDSEDQGNYVFGSGTSWNFMVEGASTYGIHSKMIEVDEAVMKDELRNNHYIICSMDPGDFTTSGHFIVLTGVDDEGAFTINDSNSRKRSAKHYTYQRLKDQIRAAWVYSI